MGTTIAEPRLTGDGRAVAVTVTLPLVATPELMRAALDDALAEVDALAEIERLRRAGLERCSGADGLWRGED